MAALNGNGTVSAVTLPLFAMFLGIGTCAFVVGSHMVKGREPAYPTVSMCAFRPASLEYYIFAYGLCTCASLIMVTGFLIRWRFWEQRTCGGRGACNAWVFCGSPRCFSYDVHNHTFGECWLKHEPDIASPIAAGPTLPRAMREAPRRQWPWAVSEKLWAGLPPERLQWQSGIVAPRDANVWTNVRLPGWHKGWCKRHGSCGEG